MRRRFLILLFGVAACVPASEAGLDTTTTSTTSTTSTTTTPTTTTTTTTTLPLLTATGRVVGPSGEPVSGAAVALSNHSAQTGGDGIFAIETISPGILVVTKPGWQSTEIDWDGTATQIVVELEPAVVRGLRVWGEIAGDDQVFDGLLALAEQTSVNALVFDTKQEGGRVLYETSVVEAVEMGAVEPMYDPAVRIAQAESHGLYLITRIVVFEDALRVAARPEEKLAGRWLDPRVESAWDYNIDLAVEACRLGFHEIQFDYVRFPAGRTAEVSGQRGLSEEERVAAIASFLAKAETVVEAEGCAVGAAIFSIVVSSQDDQGIGQRVEELSDVVDVLSPMIYPSHYSPGWLGFPDPNDHPYEVTADAIEDTLSRLAPGTVLRPWLQGFWWSNAQIRGAIQAAEDRGVGWTLWNVRSNYDASALPTDEEVAAVP
jgi:hypothetical protein